MTENPFEVDDIINFQVRSKVYDFPSMSLWKLKSLDGI